MVEYVSKDQSIIITTHEIDEIENIVDEVIILDEGKVIFKSDARELH